jgi:hypothetical protein
MCLRSFRFAMGSISMKEKREEEEEEEKKTLPIFDVH